THLIGGKVVLFFLLAVVPLSGGSHINLMRSEIPGPSVGKLVPKIKASARILYLIYMGLTAAEFLFLVLGRMSVFEAINTSFATAGNGGFGCRNDSFASFSPYLQWVVTIFMILLGVNFNAYYLVLYRKFKKALIIEEIRYYFIIIGIAVAFITVSLIRSSVEAFSALTQASFQVASIITTTGFSTADFDTWSQSCRMILVLLMFIGACAGSTGGGIKVSRIVVMVKTVKKELNSFIHPKSVKKIKMGGNPLEHEVLRSINVFLISYILVFVLSMFIVSLEGYDLVTDFTAVAATINNIGPGLALVGPTQNFGFLNAVSKIVLIFDMLAGRLELFPLLILFHPGMWRETFEQKKKHRSWYKENKA
ncbi:MAG: TrkH family potassium uptake protein, partial [Eubacterium sp.]|nr:TrkH family potassium uptake protein [Eubacterium sp.]